MKSFNRFLFLLATITDPRRAEGKLYKLQHVLLFSILAVVSGANSYRTIHTFIETHLRKLKKVFKIKWKKAPCYSEIRFVLQNLNPDDVEKAFREHAAMLKSARRCGCGVFHRHRRQDAETKLRRHERR